MATYLFKTLSCIMILKTDCTPIFQAGSYCLVLSLCKSRIVFPDPASFETSSLIRECCPHSVANSKSFYTQLGLSQATKCQAGQKGKKSIDLPGRKINYCLSGKHNSLPFLPATPSSPTQTLEGLFELTQRPSWALDWPGSLLPVLQRNKDTQMCQARRRGPRTASTTLIVLLLKTHLFLLF